jgi:hypothetical protein
VFSVLIALLLSLLFFIFDPFLICSSALLTQKEKREMNGGSHPIMYSSRFRFDGEKGSRGDKNSAEVRPILLPLCSILFYFEYFTKITRWVCTVCDDRKGGWGSGGEGQRNIKNKKKKIQKA